MKCTWVGRKVIKVLKLTFHKLSLAKGKQAQRGVLWVVHWIYDLLLMLKERPQTLIGQGKTSSRRGLMGGSLNLWSFACVEWKATNSHWPRENKLKDLWVVHWIHDLLFVLKEKDLWLIKEFWQRGVRLRKRKC
jgi:hypothetical protein